MKLVGERTKPRMRPQRVENWLHRQHSHLPVAIPNGLFNQIERAIVFAKPDADHRGVPRRNPLASRQQFESVKSLLGISRSAGDRVDVAPQCHPSVRTRRP